MKTTLARFRKRPVEVWAMRYDGSLDSAKAIEAWACETPSEFGRPRALNLGDDVFLSVATLEGCMTAKAGEWIIKGVNGEFYPCKPDVFAKTYEAV